ncbi:VWA domain-containing protein [Nocardia sp. 2]|uniref:VWA domain-containing protein n=1 Tax=Nocardia acididurans TaxID=2802282 RepID=A0ABS1M9Q6_9NOCA|nr:vWA domain-containing protein [Nocardia acididurans]MBL1077375.1 VWA domain-containing protein [Nocardia acididurans]
MTNPDLTLIAVLVDRSGSMQHIKSDTEGGFAAYMDQQRQVPKRIEVTLAQFDTEYDLRYANRPLDQVPPLELLPRGMTALYDAVGRLVTDVGAELAARPDDARPGTVVVVVLTDGHENSSREWSHAAVKSLITQQQDVYNWNFLFLGANMDAVAIGTGMGVAPGSSITYSAGAKGVSGVFRAASAYTARLQAAAPGARLVDGFTDEEREQSNPGH